MEKKSEEIKKVVKEKYAEVAKGGSCCGPADSEAQQQKGSSCCGPAGSQVRQELANRRERVVERYGEEAASELPESVIAASAGCGNPVAIAALRPGQMVLDLGSGGGIDCFLAAQQVGPQGRVIGVDMTPEMVKLARDNARKMGVSNVEFRLAEMEHLPLESNSVDVVLSNCVINLSTDKDAVFREAFRVLRPGGRLSISDIVSMGELPPEIRESYEAWAGCMGGALDQEVYLGKIKAAGFATVAVESASDFDFKGSAMRRVKISAVKAEG